MLRTIWDSKPNQRRYKWSWIPDIMIGAPGTDFGGISNIGEIYVIFGGSGFSLDSLIFPP